MLIVKFIAEDGVISLGVPYNDIAHQEYDPTILHVIINQVYGGKKKEAYASHSFIELYNQSDEDVDITGWSLHYRSSIDGGDNDEWSKLTLSGTIPSHCSYLVRCSSIKNPVAGSIVIDDYDQEWNQVINNKGCSVVLVANNETIPADSIVFDNETSTPVIYDYVDMVGVSGNDTDTEENIANEAALFYEKEASPIQSKKNGIRREKLEDTDNNAEKADFIAVDYSFANADYIAYISPKCVADGAWVYDKSAVPKYTVTFVEDESKSFEENFKYNTKVDKPEDPEKDGYTFTGWFTDEKCTKEYNFKTKPIEDITLYAGWTPTEYSITYENVEGATNTNVISYTIEDEDITLVNPEKDGSIFYGWYDNAGCLGDTVTVVSASDIEDKILYAKWKDIVTPAMTLEDWTYGDVANTPVVTASVSVTGSAITFEYKAKGAEDSEYTENVPTEAGIYTVRATVSETDDNVFNAIEADFTIDRAQATVKAIDASKVYGDIDPALSAEVSGLKGTDTAEIIAYDIYRSSGETVGSYTMLPTGDTVQGNYDVVYTTGTFTIDIKIVTDPVIVLSEDTYTYDGTEKVPKVTVRDGNKVIDSSEYTVSITNNTYAGTATVTVSDKVDGNYDVSGSTTFTISKAVPVITTKPTAGSLNFGQSLADSAVTGGAVSVAGTFAWDNAEIIPSVANSGVTEYSVVFTPADTNNYDTVKFGVKVSVSKAEPQYTIPTGITAVYGDALADVELPDGWAWADGSLGVGDVGVHSFTAIYTPVDTVNFNNAEAPIEVSVGKDAPALTIPVTKANLTYTGTAQELVSVSAVSGGAISFAVTYSDGVDLVGVPGVDAFSGAIPTGTSAGTYTVWFKVTGDDNHLDTEPASLTAVIGRASAVVYADNSSKAYGEADPALSAAVSGLKGSDTQDVLSYSLFRSAGESAGTYNIIAMGDAVQGNYNVSYVQGAFTIETKTVADPVIVLSQDSFVYDGTEKTPSVTVRVGNTIIDPSEYTVSYSNNTEAGTATVTITDKVGGSFEISGSATFTITEPETENQGEDKSQSGDDQGDGQGQDDTQSGNEQFEGQGQDNTQSGTEQGEGQGQDDNQSGPEQGEGQGQDDTQSGTEQGEGQGQDDTQSGTGQGEGQGQDDTQSGTEQGEGQGQDDTQSGDDQGEGQGQDDTQSGIEQGEGQGQDDTQSGTEQGEGQGETQSGTEQGNDQNQSGAEQGSQQSSTDNGNSGYAPVIVPSDNTSVVVNDLSNTGSKDSSSNNGTDGKDTEKDTDKVNDIPSVSESVKDVIEIATSELFESITELMTGSTKGSDVVVELKVSKTKLTVKKGKTSKIKPKLVTKSADGTVQTVSDVSQFRFMSLNPSIAKVSKNGTVTGRSNGSCTIYVIAQNGMVKQIKITVK